MGCALAHPINHNNMRTKALFLWALFCTMCLNNAFGQKSIDIEVRKDTVIIVGDLFSDTDGTKIYGDKVGEERFGGIQDKFFQPIQVEPNQGKNGVEVFRNDDKRVALNIVYETLKDTEIEIVPAILVSDPAKAKILGGGPGYYPDKDAKIIIKIKKGDVDVNKLINTPVTGADNYQPATTTDVDSDPEEDVDKEESTSYSKWHLLLGALLLLLLCYFLFKPNRKKIKKLEAECSKLQDEVNSLKKRMVQNNNLQNTRQEEIKRPDTMTREEIQAFVVSQIKIAQSQMPTVSPVYEQPKEPAKQQDFSTVLDTDKVKYHSDSNSFTIENVENPIFRIYSSGNDFFYTIVDDSATRQELVGIIPSYAGCITYQTTEGEASRVEPVSPGKLYKDGNSFLVDTNNKLVVRFVK